METAIFNTALGEFGIGWTDAGLVIAEVELDSEDQAVQLPDWVGVEVSADERYFNASLARSDGVPK